jgi:hypothetical protein
MRRIYTILHLYLMVAISLHLLWLIKSRHHVQSHLWSAFARKSTDKHLFLAQVFMPTFAGYAERLSPCDGR